MFEVWLGAFEFMYRTSDTGRKQRTDLDDRWRYLSILYIPMGTVFSTICRSVNTRAHVTRVAFFSQIPQLDSLWLLNSRCSPITLLLRSWWHPAAKVFCWWQGRITTSFGYSRQCMATNWVCLFMQLSSCTKQTTQKVIVYTGINGHVCCVLSKPCVVFTDSKHIVTN